MITIKNSKFRYMHKIIKESYNMKMAYKNNVWRARKFA